MARDRWYEIYQMKENSPLQDYLFRDLEVMRGAGKEPHLVDYDMIYRAKFNYADLSSLYTEFNINHPDDYFGWSLSVSDIVCLHNPDGNINAFYLNGIGLEELSSFAKEVKEKKGVSHNKAMYDWSYAPVVTDKVKNYFKSQLKTYLDDEIHYLLTNSLNEGTWDSLVADSKDVVYMDNLHDNVDTICNNLDYFAKNVELDLGKYQIQDTLHEFIYENKLLDKAYGCTTIAAIAENKIEPAKNQEYDDRNAIASEIVSNGHESDKTRAEVR